MLSVRGRSQQPLCHFKENDQPRICSEDHPESRILQILSDIIQVIQILEATDGFEPPTH